MTLCWILIFLTFQFLNAEEANVEIYAQAGGKVILQRETHGRTLENLRDVYVNWFRGSEKTPIISRNPQGGKQGKEHPRVSFLEDFSLQISPIEESDFGDFRCEQHLLINAYTYRYKLRRVTVSKVQAVIVGETLTLKSKLEKSSLGYSLTVKWIPPKNPNCTLDPRITNRDISVSNVPMCASGVWKCIVQYDGREVTALTTVYVIDLAPAPSKPIYTAVKNTVNIPCSLSSDIPWTLLNESGLQGGSWSFTPQGNENQQPLLSLIVGSQAKWNVTKDAQIAVRERTLTDKDLSILQLPVSEKMRGEYTCTLVFKKKTFSRKVKVEVLQVSSSANSSLKEGQMVNLSCSLGPHTITPEVNWTLELWSSSCSLLSSSYAFADTSRRRKTKFCCYLECKAFHDTSNLILLYSKERVLTVFCLIICFDVYYFELVILCRLVRLFKTHEIAKLLLANLRSEKHICKSTKLFSKEDIFQTCVECLILI
ncbi:hypothetical protein E1301_Tti010741 [Triplophysa tibetana]|uniref:Immunoglobulin domain-containing protein n=1 Tax=Triplophysa tibetana TaxID=1572043 RepID=A0A5A9N2A7_9TELE|nr:hypothetical protein E1301_Tti010741 [Triplophysa tibetana]